jgi:hypothetical protein
MHCLQAGTVDEYLLAVTGVKWTTRTLVGELRPLSEPAVLRPLGRLVPVCA